MWLDIKTVLNLPGRAAGKGESLDFVQLMLNCHSMETKKATKIFEALMSEERLGIFKLLVKHARKEWPTRRCKRTHED